MPAWVSTPAEERRWQRAKQIVRQQRSKKEAEFAERDWALANHIFHNMSASVSTRGSERVNILLAHVESLIEARKSKKDKNADLPDDVRMLVEALSGVMAYGGQTISALRKEKTTGLSEEESAALAEELENVAVSVKSVLDKLKAR
jgi:hypothetical protein